MKPKALLLFIILFSTTAFAKYTPVTDILYYSVNVSQPVINDSSNAKGDKYEALTLLDSRVTEPEYNNTGNSGWKKITPSADSVYRVDKPEKGHQISLWKFYLTTDRYLPLKVEIKSANPFIVYLDGEKKSDKKTFESKVGNAKKTTITLNAEPKQYTFVVKMLTSANDSCETVLYAEAKTEDRDSLAVVNLSSSPSRNLYFEDFNTGKKVSSTTISRDGRFVLINYTTTFKDGTTSSSTELKDLNNNRTIWNIEKDPRGLIWANHASILYYTIKGASGKELRTVDPLTQEEKVLVKDLPEGAFTWSPKGNYLIYSISESAEEDKGELKRFISPEDRQPGYRSRSSLYKYDISSGLLTRLTYGKENTWLSDISKDEKHILFSIMRNVLTVEPYSETDMYMLNVETMQVDTIWQHEKFATNSLFSPDAKKILIQGGPESFKGIGLNIEAGQKANLFDIQGFIMDLNTRKIEAITKDFNPSISNAVWSKYDNKIYFDAEDMDYERIFIYDPEKKTFERLKISPDVVRGFDLATGLPRAVYYGSTNTYTGKAYVIDLKSKKETTLCDPGAERLSNVNFSKTGDWNFKSSDGTLITGRYYLPPNFDESKKYPLLVYYYGGTSPISRSFESNYPLNFYAAQGYVVYTLQPSGTTGFGQKFSARHVNAWGDYTADEIILGTKLFCKAHNFVDSTKIGCFGASYGGFMTMLLQTKTDIYKAAISHAGISSITSYWGEGYWGYSYSAGASTGSWPWNNPKLYIEHSPLFYADKINTPLLLLHGTADTNVPIGESIQLYTALKVLGKEVEFVRVQDEDHSIRKFSHRLDWYRTQLAWFSKYLKGDDRWWNDLYKKSELEK